MAEPADPGAGGTLRDLAERVLPLGGSPSREQVRAAVDRLVRTGKLSPDDADALVDELVTASKGTGQRLTERAGGALSGLADQLGLVRERQLDELELRVAQLEHRLRLVEQRSDSGDEPTPTGG